MTGFICLDKPGNITSFSAVGIVRKITGEKKAGHTGTLDPMATGVLPVAVGSATRFIELFENHDKAYEATVKLGTVTDTLDITGKIISQTNSNVKKEELFALLPEFTGNIEQVPPMYSAVKKDGVRLYEIARKGGEVERQARPVTVYSLECGAFDEEKQEFILSVECSAGTYIRTLAYDIGERLGCGAVLTSLRRTKALGFTEKDCFTCDELREMKENGTLDKAVLSVEKALGYERLTVTEKQACRFRNGGFLDAKRIGRRLEPETLYGVFSPAAGFVGIGRTDSSCSVLNVKRVFMGDASNG